MKVLIITWKDEKNRRCTTFYCVPEIKGKIIDIDHKEDSELKKLEDLITTKEQK